MSQTSGLPRAIVIAGALIGLGIATPSIIASITQHQRYVAIGDSNRVLDTRTGAVCFPGEKLESFSARHIEWNALGKRCDRIEISE